MKLDEKVNPHAIPEMNTPIHGSKWAAKMPPREREKEMLSKVKNAVIKGVEINWRPLKHNLGRLKNNLGRLKNNLPLVVLDPVEWVHP